LSAVSYCIYLSILISVSGPQFQCLGVLSPASSPGDSFHSMNIATLTCLGQAHFFGYWACCSFAFSKGSLCFGLRLHSLMGFDASFSWSNLNPILHALFTGFIDDFDHSSFILQC